VKRASSLLVARVAATLPILVEMALVPSEPRWQRIKCELLSNGHCHLCG
jgi:hypothetical protein